MPFYAVHEGTYEGVQSRIDFLRKACLNRGVEFVDVDSVTLDYSALPRLGKTDILYQVSIGAQTLISLLLNKEVTTPYIVNPELNLITSTTQWSLLHDKLGFSAPKTLFHFTNNRALLKRYVEYLGGFPIIIKKAGSSRGVGTIKVDCWHGMLSVADYLVTTGDEFILRQFILAEYGVRAMVLAGKIIKIAKFLFQENDFRNAAVLSGVRYEPYPPGLPDLTPLCAGAMRAANLEFGGVDLLFDASGKEYLLEVNYPTGFQSFADDPYPVLERLVNHLADKAGI